MTNSIPNKKNQYVHNYVVHESKTMSIIKTRRDLNLIFIALFATSSN